MSTSLERRRIYGAGPEWVFELGEEMAGHLDQLNCMELIPENFFDIPERLDFLEELSKTDLPVLIHAVGLSLATDEPLKSAHLDRVLSVADKVNAVGLSEHLSMTEAGGIDIGQLTPISWSIESADVVIRKIEQIQRCCSLPFALEHVAYRFFFPQTELSEPDFINRILDRTGCGLILDLNNLYCNAKNANYDPHIWLEQIRLESVTTIHLAGGFQSLDGTYQDGHNCAVPDPVWNLLDYVLGRITPQSIIVERTGNYPGIDALLAEIQRAESALRFSLDARARVTQ
jgi:uncharacterized protein (UPF0276 family)